MSTVLVHVCAPQPVAVLATKVLDAGWVPEEWDGEIPLPRYCEKCAAFVSVKKRTWEYVTYDPEETFGGYDGWQIKQEHYKCKRCGHEA